jgi:ribonucleoside-diphosphate reductase alpha chain
MNSLKDSHPDIKEFILAKSIEEDFIEILTDAGVSYEDARDTVAYQNTNLSVRVTDKFMEAVENDEEWPTFPIHNLEMEMPIYKARELFDYIAVGTHKCGDPGLQFHDTINKMHTCPGSGPINASNPCSEYMFIDDSSCNLASHNLIQYVKKDGSFDINAFTKAVGVFTWAQDLLYKFSSYPEKKIAENSENFRPLGMGYANLGAFLMREGIPYDSDEARGLAGAISSLMTATVYEASAKMAAKLGPFKEFEKNKESMFKVLEMHKGATEKINAETIPEKYRNIRKEALKRWRSAIRLGKQYGFRNAQATVLAPTGTISFLMDCDTTGIEPDLALVKHKLLAGGGLLKIVNESVAPALEKLGYNPEQIEDIRFYIRGHEKAEGAPHLNERYYKQIDESDNKKETLNELGYDEGQIDEILCFIDGYDTIEGAPHIRQEHLPVFDCSFKARRGKRSLSARSHVKMMASVQPFLSGAISKTVNLNKDVTVEEIKELYKEAHRLGLKAIAMYRDGTKRGQPVTAGKGLEGKVWRHKPVRRRLPETRQSITHKFSVAGHEGYLTVGLYEDESPGELFITMAKEGSTVGGLMDVIGTQTSIALQYGVPLKDLASKFRHMRFEPAGMTSDKSIPFAKSLIDYIFTWLQYKFIGRDKPSNRPQPGLGNDISSSEEKSRGGKDDGKETKSEGKTCIKCGNIFEPTHCGDLCPHCNTPDYAGCEGGPV